MLENTEKSVQHSPNLGADMHAANQKSVASGLIGFKSLNSPLKLSMPSFLTSSASLDTSGAMTLSSNPKYLYASLPGKSLPKVDMELLEGRVPVTGEMEKCLLEEAAVAVGEDEAITVEVRTYLVGIVGEVLHDVSPKSDADGSHPHCTKVDCWS